MTKIKLGAISIGIVFLLIACGDTTKQSNTNTSQTTTTPTPAAQPTPDTLAVTRTLYADQCAVCHKESGEGGPATVGKKKINAASLKKGKAVTASDDELIKIITNGEEAMPSFKDDLSAEQIKSLVQFIRKEFQGGNK